METLQRGGRRIPGFGVGSPPPQSPYVRPALDMPRPTGKVAAFLGGALGSGLAGVAATALFGEGTNLSLSSAGQRLARSWRPIAATAVVGGIVAAIVK
jgi:hypothetical protein